MRESESQPSTSRSQKPKYERSYQDRRTCFNCGDLGHVSYKCQNFQRPIPRPEIRKHLAPKQLKTPNVKVELGRASTSKATEYKQKQNIFDICSGRGPNSSSALFDKRKQLSKKNPRFYNMSLEDVDNYVNQSTTQAHVKPVEKARSKSPKKVQQPKANPVSESVSQIIYQKKTLSKQQQWKPKTASVVSGSASTSPGGEWIEIIQTDATGQPKTIRAWVPASN